MSPLLTAGGLSFSYGPQRVLDGVSLAVSSGEAVALMGPSGAGKSTLLTCLAGLRFPSSGSVFFGKVNIAELQSSARAHLRLSQFGFVWQDVSLIPELTLLENVMLPLRLLKARYQQAEGRALEVMGRLGIGGLAARYAEEVSGGEAQRAAVARAVVHAPKVVFADEPTGALDSVNGAAVMDALLHSVRNVGAALVMVTHDQELAKRLDRVTNLLDGRVVEQARTAGRRDFQLSTPAEPC